MANDIDNFLHSIAQAIAEGAGLVFPHLDQNNQLVKGTIAIYQANVEEMQKPFAVIGPSGRDLDGVQVAVNQVSLQISAFADGRRPAELLVSRIFDEVLCDAVLHSPRWNWSILPMLRDSNDQMAVDNDGANWIASQIKVISMPQYIGVDDGMHKATTNVMVEFFREL